MNDNIQIINKSGDGMSTEGISYIEVPSTTKKYLFYTLNEKVDNDLTKIYISEVNPDGIVENPIADTEWEDLRQKMIKISHKEAVDDVNFLNMSGVKFNVGDPKKLAITAVAKQAFKDAQISNTMATNQSETPVTMGSSPSFFNQEVVGNQVNPVEVFPAEQSIFSNPPQPDASIPAQQPTPSVPPFVAPTLEPTPAAPNLVDTQVATPEVSAPHIQENLTSTPESIISPVELNKEAVVAQSAASADSLSQGIQPMDNITQSVANTNQIEVQAPPLIENNQPPATVKETIVPPIPSFEPTPVVQEPLVSDIPAFESTSMSESSTPSTAVEQVQEIPAQPLESLETVKPEEKVSTETVPPKPATRPIITDEEALKAINTIQEYINQESENNNQ